MNAVASLRLDLPGSNVTLKLSLPPGAKLEIEYGSTQSVWHELPERPEKLSDVGPDEPTGDKTSAAGVVTRS